MLRTDVQYVDGKGQFTQAGVRAVQSVIDAQAAAMAAQIAVLQAADATEAANAPGSAPRYACRAWVNFNGTGTPTIRASGNVASITDNGTGDYTINFTTPMPDANYTVALSYSNEVNVQHAVGFVLNQTASSVRVQFYNAANSANSVDKSTVCVAIFR